MSFNFSELQQSVNRLLLNSSEAINKWRDFVLTPAGDIQVQYYNSQGQLVTETLPNRAKLFNQLLNDAKQIMEKTVYVNQSTGDDNNDGTQNRPFKTLQKAVDSVPAGGLVSIYIQGDYVLTSDVLVSGKKTVNIYLDGKLTTEWHIVNQTVASVYNIQLIGNSIVQVFSCSNAVSYQFEIPSRPSNMQGLTLSSTAGLFYVLDTRIGNILIRPQDSVQHNVSIAEGSLIVNSWGVGKFSIILLNSNGSITLGNNAFLVNLASAGVATCKLSLAGSITKGGSTVNPPYTSLFGGIIRDTNNVPRNIISNYVL